MIRHALIAFAAAAAIAGAVGCGPVAADATYHEHSETAEYTIDITYPLGYPDPKAVSDFVAADRTEFVDWVAQVGSDGRNRPYVYDVSAKAYSAAQPATTSLVLTIDNDTGGAHQGHPATSFKAFNFDVAKQTPITFDTLFKPDAKPLEVLTPMARKLYDAPMLGTTAVGLSELRPHRRRRDLLLRRGRS